MIARLREILADRLSYSAYVRDAAIAAHVDRVYQDNVIEWDDANDLVRSLTITRLEEAFIDLQYALAAALRPDPTTIDQEDT